MRIRVLGRLAMDLGDGPVDAPPGMPGRLLGYLALHPGRRSRAHVAGQLWPDCSPEVARHRLRTALWEVQRTTAGVRLVDVARHDLSLEEGVDVDLWHARSLVEDGEYEEALRLLAPGLADELDQSWAEGARQKVAELRQRALELAMQDAERGQRPDLAVPYARELVQVDLLSEAAHRELVRLLAASGDRGAAMAAYEEMRRVLETELGIGPSPESRQLLAQLGSDAPPAEMKSVTHPGRRPAVPVSSTPLLGRDDDLTRLHASVIAQRLVCVVGPAGVGKSRLAFAVAELEVRRGCRVSVAELATTRRGDAVDFVVAAALGLPAGLRRDIRYAMVDFLETEPGLLVLDNCEHVLERAADLVAHLLRWSPSTRILATSRAALGLPAEQRWPLMPLPVPDRDDDESTILDSPSVRLLVAAATRANPSTRPQRHDARQLAELVRHLDGLPLALELAAARVGVLGAEVLTQRLVAGLDTLSPRPPPAGAGTSRRARDIGRHDSLLRTLAWSAALLSPHDRTLLGLISLLPGPFPLDAARELAASVEVAVEPVEGLNRLVEASLVQVHPDEVRCYSTLETIRTFGSTLLPADTAARGRQGLVSWAERFADDAKRRGLTAEERVHAELTLFLPLVRAAVLEAWERDNHKAVDRIVMSIEGWSTWREQSEVWAWIVRAADEQPADGADAELLRMGALAALRQGDITTQRRLTGRCVDAHPAGPTGESAIQARMTLAWADGRWDDIIDLYPLLPIQAHIGDDSLLAKALIGTGQHEAAVTLARRMRTRAVGSGASLQGLALVTEAQACMAAGMDGASEQVAPLLRAARALYRSVGSSGLLAALDSDAGLNALRHGRPDDARGALRAACLHWLITGNTMRLGPALEGLNLALAETGRADAAERIRDAHRQGTLTARQLAAWVPPVA